MAYPIRYLTFTQPFPNRARRSTAQAAVWSVFLLWVLAGAMVVPARAQMAPPDEQWVRFTLFSARPITDLAFAARTGDVPQPLVFFPTTRSPRYEYRGAMPLRFTDATTGEVVAEARIPRDLRDVLLLVSPLEARPVAADGPPLRYRIAVLDESAARHGPGGLVIINLSGLVLEGKVGTESITLRAGLNPTLKVDGATNIAFRTHFKNRSYHSYSGMVELTPTQRALLILFPPFYEGSVEVQPRLLVDEPPVEPHKMTGKSGARGRD